MNATRHGEAVAVPHSSGCAPPTHATPEGAVDCHHHVFDPAFPRPSGLLTTIGTKSDYLLFRLRLGLSRSIIVAPSTYGSSNACLLDALAAYGDTARGVAIVSAGTPFSTLQELHRAGVRGVRLYLGRGTPPTPREIREHAAAIAPLGWHIEIVVSHESSLLCAAEATLSDLPCRVVIDHFGFIRQPGALQTAAYASLRRLLDAGHVWTKLSGVYHVSDQGPAFADVAPFARALIQGRPDRLLWGSDWPHTGAGAVKPDGARLLDQLWDWTDAPVVRRILVENPDQLYWKTA